MRTRLILFLVLSGVLLAAASPAGAATFRATLKAPGHNPKASQAWTITVTATTISGKPLRATAYYQFLYNGQVVATRYPSPSGPDRHSPYAFRGSYRDPIDWPASAVGQPLTFRVVVTVPHRGRKLLDYAVRVRR
jgi:hypothetical protein